ncbi:MAG: aminopeptidase P family N-terminal domain-containing protein, partial [Bacteroidota bacterium]
MQQRLDALRTQLSEKGLFALIIPNTDPHQSEYIADYWRVMKYLTGFSGSTGNVVVSADFAGVWTDSRYFLQAESQLKGSGYELVKLKIPHTPEYIDWIAEQAHEGAKVGIDARLFSVALYKRMENSFAEKGIEIIDVGDLISPLWPDRPEIPLAPIFIHDQSFAGKSRASKLRELRKAMTAKEADYTFISSLDDIAWL